MIMTRYAGRFLFVLIFLGLMLSGAGCSPKPVGGEDVILCPGKLSIEEAVDAIRDQQDRALPIRGRGKCKISWIEDNKTKDYDLDVDLRFCPPDRLYLNGTYLSKEYLRAGTNAEEFWLRAKEMETYQWGRWVDAQMCPSHQLMNPANLLDALGQVKIDESYKLTNEGAYDVFTLSDNDGFMIKQVYVYCCDYTVAKIKYFGEYGQVSVSIDLEDYTTVDDVSGTKVPGKISIINLESGSMKIDVKLNKSVRVFKDKDIKDALFDRAKCTTKGIDNVYKLNSDCEFERQE